jgi:hypothetical protein
LFLLSKLLWLLYLEEPALLVLNLALLDTLQSREESLACWAWFLLCLCICEFVVLRGQSDRLDGNKSRRGSCSKYFVKGLQLVIGDLEWLAQIMHSVSA